MMSPKMSPKMSPMMCPTFPRSSRATAAALVTLSLAAALLVAPARAAEPGNDTSDGWKKVLSFAHCAVNVFRAVTPTDWTIAFLDCTRLFMEEPPLPGGGGQP